MLAASNATRGIYQAAGLSTRKLDGDAELRKIATAGREWMFTVGRKIDMESGWSSQVPDCALMVWVVYVYRLCLEWGRLSAENRTEMSYGFRA